ncbi:helix-turn-helix transcriptional regulator [Pseudonocardia hydrocarbonoxydans]|uniref:HTH luxR-type domain-containing protein n=1 Tax=Pseudonocardia hydrocarbonoxydans TaxID=76726 RepID=A0A4Y3WS62_9PSEU|nr:helix-turn-helix transcriptional regulator [Pseudonocardia hydrocarbonoxydans]GEC21131.1 hypothetical protein PHY01_34140 [Pseudonocardia hydrocarbonoxydans]
MRAHRRGELLLAETATSPGAVAGRASAVLDDLRPVSPLDGAWIALADPLRHGYPSLADVAPGRPVADVLSGPPTAHDGVVTGGVDEALALALFAPHGRHVGFIALLSGSRRPPTPDQRDRLARMAPALAHGIDPMRSLLTASRMVRGATAAVVLAGDHGCRTLPGLPTNALLVPGSPVLALARDRIDDGHTFSSFLWPLGGPHAPAGHVRVTALAAPEDVPAGLTGLALLSPAGDLHQLTARELEVLGLLIEGCSNQEIARALVVAPRTVATHLEHLLAKLGAPTRTLAAVRAEREGLYVPSAPLRRWCLPPRRPDASTTSGPGTAGATPWARPGRQGSAPYA